MAVPTTTVARTSLFLIYLLVLLTFKPTSSKLPKKFPKELSPVILMPGYGASTIHAKLNKSQVLYPFCDKQTKDYFTLWLDYKLLFPRIINCWIENMKLIYDNVTRRTNYPPGVDIRIPDFGDPVDVEWYSTKYRIMPYFRYIAQKLTISLDYKRLETLFAAGYDWRKSPFEMDAYYTNLTNLTEFAYHKQKEPVTYICHSMGCTALLYYLNSQPQKWKDKYVKRMISIAGAYGGCMKTLKTLISGDDLTLPYVDASDIRKQQRSCSSLASMLPSDAVWSKNRVLIENRFDKINYTIKNILHLFKRLNATHMWEMYQDVRHVTRRMNAPNVEIYCINGRGVNTIEKLIYSNDFPDGDIDVVHGDGDGTINMRSLQICQNFAKKQNQSVHSFTLHRINHLKILYNDKVLSYIAKILKS